MKRICLTLLAWTTAVGLSIFGVINDNDLPGIVEVEKKEVTYVETTVTSPTPVKAYQSVKCEMKSKMVELTKPVEEEKGLSEEEIDLLALVTMAEAEGESDEGKRLVIDTILNRADSELSYFPDNVTDVVYQKNAFSSMWNGRANRCYVDEDIRRLVLEELDSRTNYEVMYFHANKYGKYGTPMFSVGNHYFSSK